MFIVLFFWRMFNPNLCSKQFSGTSRTNLYKQLKYNGYRSPFLIGSSELCTKIPIWIFEAIPNIDTDLCHRRKNWLSVMEKSLFLQI